MEVIEEGQAPQVLRFVKADEVFHDFNRGG